MAEQAFKDPANSKTAWETDIASKLVDDERDALYSLDVGEQKVVGEQRPWKKDPNHFKNIRISSNALMKMTIHARSGGSIEVMGLMQGKVEGDTIIVSDAFRLPVEGTETRVNAGDEANEYIVNYLDLCRQNGMLDNAVGWYHSHPGYGCWLSGIDVRTQETYQMYQDPFVAVVIDPNRTVSSGRVEIGAFRTYPEGYKPDRVIGASEDGVAGIPSEKSDDFGKHAERYYPLEVSHFKSTLNTQMLDLLWNKYWVSTLSQNPLASNKEYSTMQIADLGQKLRGADKKVKTIDRSGQVLGKDNHLDKVTGLSNKVAGAEARGLLAEEIKNRLFTGIVTPAKDSEAMVEDK